MQGVDRAQRNVGLERIAAERTWVFIGMPPSAEPPLSARKFISWSVER
jgi:hypothetical protein